MMVPAGLELAPLRWWHLPEVAALDGEAFGAERWAPEAFWSELAQRPLRHYVVVLDAGQVVGDAGASLPDTPGGEAFVQTVAVAASHRRRGVASVMLASLLEAAVGSGAGSVGLEVRADDPGAQLLYRRAGFRGVGRRRGYYQPSGADALVMVTDDPAGGLVLLGGPPVAAGVPS